jgi:hypothetical protein
METMVLIDFFSYSENQSFSWHMGTALENFAKNVDYKYKRITNFAFKTA